MQAQAFILSRADRSHMLDYILFEAPLHPVEFLLRDQTSHGDANTGEHGVVGLTVPQPCVCPCPDAHPATAYRPAELVGDDYVTPATAETVRAQSAMPFGAPRYVRLRNGSVPSSRGTPWRDGLA